MTTIAADVRSGLMVADSKCTYGETWVPVVKVFRVGNELVGCAGDVKEWTAFLRWYRGGRRGARPKGEDYTALILRPDGLYQFDSDGLDMRLERDFHAIGTGAHAALGAMLAGASVHEAVRIACLVDPQSGGDLATLDLKKDAA